VIFQGWEIHILQRRGTVFALLLGILILVSIGLMVIVLLQAGKGGGLAAMGGGSAGTDTFIGGRQAASLLTKGTWTAGAVFLVLALVLSILSSRSQTPASILQQEFRQTTPTPQPVLPGVEPVAPGPEPTTVPQP
jgi:preprotein translocase subunit SecG